MNITKILLVISVITFFLALILSVTILLLFPPDSKIRLMIKDSESVTNSISNEHKKTSGTKSLKTNLSSDEVSQESLAQIVWTLLPPSGNSISLDGWIQAKKSKVPAQLSTMLDQKSWDIHHCHDASFPDEFNFVLRLHFKLFTNYQGNLHDDQINYLNEWEKTIVVDLAPIFFPDQTIESDDVQINVFQSDEIYNHINYRDTAVVLNQNLQKIIGYALVGDDLLISNNRMCLIGMQQNIQEPDNLQ